MRPPVKSALITIALAGLAGVVGVWLGGRLLSQDTSGAHSLHTMVHEELSLSPEQEQQIESLEQTFAVRRKVLEEEMRDANRELATAIRNSEAAGPEVAAAVRHLHDAMGALQNETIEHVFAMRRVLTPEQRTHFDDKISQALTPEVE